MEKKLNKSKRPIELNFSKIETLIIGVVTFIFSADLYTIYNNSILAGVIGVAIGTVLAYVNIFFIKKLFYANLDNPEWNANLFKFITFVISSIFLFFLMRDWYLNKRIFNTPMSTNKVLGDIYINFFIALYPYILVSILMTFVILVNLSYRKYYNYYLFFLSLLLLVLSLFHVHNIFKSFIFIFLFSSYFSIFQIFDLFEDLD